MLAMFKDNQLSVAFPNATFIKSQLSVTDFPSVSLQHSLLFTNILNKHMTKTL
jgi:hypothetical protein